jgi:hypothetical protein
MIEAILIAWIALAVLTAWGFHLTRRHWARVREEAQWRHPMWGNRAENYDWEDDE